MITQGAMTIILNDRDEILLAKRQDYPLWDLPGGRMEELETPIECAIREAKEETGYEIEIKEKVGEYHRPDVGDIQHIFVGIITGGRSVGSNEETRELRFYKRHKLPTWMVPHRKRQINDWINGCRNTSLTLRDHRNVISLLSAMLLK